jgi:hypothetical protein
VMPTMHTTALTAAMPSACRARRNGADGTYVDTMSAQVVLRSCAKPTLTQGAHCMPRFLFLGFVKVAKSTARPAATANSAKHLATVTSKDAEAHLGNLCHAC